MGFLDFVSVVVVLAFFPQEFVYGILYLPFGSLGAVTSVGDCVMV